MSIPEHLKAKRDALADEYASIYQAVFQKSAKRDYAQGFNAACELLDKEMCVKEQEWFQKGYKERDNDIAPLVEALEFYAGKLTWDNNGCAIDAQYYQDQPNSDVDIEYFPDVGHRAREALAKFRGSDE